MNLRRKYRARLGTVVACFACLSCGRAAQGKAEGKAAPGPRGVRVVTSELRSELHVDGSPFFVHAASFPYFQLPADLWERSLEEYRRLGINTIELRVPWNWHEVKRGEMDFEGRSNPRRDLRRLLRLVAERELKLIVWMGVRIEGWLNGGTPDWFDPSGETTETSAAGAFRNALIGELAAYLPVKAMQIPDREAKKAGEQKEISGPLIALAAPDVTAPLLSSMDAHGGPIRLRFLSQAGGGQVSPANAALRSAPGVPPPSKLAADAVATLETEAEAAKRRRNTPAIVAGIELGRRNLPDDVRPVESALTDALVTSRLLLAHGIGGVVFNPIQDSLLPAGHVPEGVNRLARVDVALDVNASRGAGARNLVRNGQLVEQWGGFLASSHKRADLAVIAAGSEARLRMAQQLSRAAMLATLAVEFVDAQMQPAEQLLQHALMVLPGPPQSEFTDAAQQTIVDYVQRGGTLVVYPGRPAGGVFSALWQGPDAQAGVRRFGDGFVVEASSDPFEWIRTDEDLSATLQNPQFAAAQQELLRWLAASRTHPIVRRERSSGLPLVITQLVTNRGTRKLGERSREGSAGLLSLTNLNGETAEEELQIISPRVSSNARGGTDMPLALTIPSRESLLLPLHTPLCSAAGSNKCDDEIIVAGAEFLWAERDGKSLELTFYVPVRATLRLRLAEQPSRVRTDEMSVDGLWTPATRQFEISIPRAPAPDYLRVVRIQLPYAPHVPEKPDPEKRGRRDYEFAVSDGIRFPLAQDTALETYPPLVILKGDHTGRMVMRGKNYDLMGRQIDFRIEGPVKGDDGLGLDPGELGFERMDLKPANGNGKNEPGFLEGKIQAKSGRDVRNLPVTFVAVAKTGVVPYKFDFDRDGATEWVLEDDHLRIVASPENGGRIVALTDKESGLSLTTSLGLLQDVEFLQTADPGASRGFGNAQYTGEWLPAKENTALKLAAPPAQPLRVEKIIRIAEKQTFEVQYRWRGPMLDQRILASVGSVPVTLHGDNTTRFCWEKPPPKEPAVPSDVVRIGAPEMHCEVFTPMGRPVQVPEGINHIEVRTPGSFALRLEWQAGRLWVQMKNYSAELRLEFPRPATGAESAENMVRYRAMVVE